MRTPMTGDSDRHPSEGGGAVGMQMRGIEGRRAADEELIALAAAEADVGNDFRNQQLADQCAIGVEAVYAFCAAAPKAARLVDAEAVKQARRAIRENLATAQRAVFTHVKDADMGRQVPSM